MGVAHQAGQPGLLARVQLTPPSPLRKMPPRVAAYSTLGGRIDVQTVDRAAVGPSGPPPARPGRHHCTGGRDRRRTTKPSSRSPPRIHTAQVAPPLFCQLQFCAKTISCREALGRPAPGATRRRRDAVGTNAARRDLRLTTGRGPASGTQARFPRADHAPRCLPRPQVLLCGAATRHEPTVIPEAAAAGPPCASARARNDTAWTVLEALTARSARAWPEQRQRPRRGLGAGRLRALGYDRVWTEPVTYPRWVRQREPPSWSPYPHRLVAAALGFRPAPAA